jgi:hypothetical protein
MRVLLVGAAQPTGHRVLTRSRAGDAITRIASRADHRVRHSQGPFGRNVSALALFHSL